MMKEVMTVDISIENFEQVVMEGSFTQPVLIDFWADWCEPCKTLTPLLEKIVGEYQGTLLLAKVNCDIEQEVVAQFGIRSLPTVILFKDGQAIDGFTGNKAESAIREMLGKHIPIPPNNLEQDRLQQAEQLYEEGKISYAEKIVKDILAVDNNQMLALILYGRCLAASGNFAEAEAVLHSVSGDEYNQKLAAATAQLAFLKQAKDLPDIDTLQAKLTSDPHNDEVYYQLAIVELANHYHELGLERLFTLFKRNRHFANDLPHKTLLKSFDLLGNDNPLVAIYRKKLYQALY